MILVKSLAACNHDKTCALKKIYEIKNYPGVSGQFSIEPDGTARKDFVLRTIQQGAFVDAN